MFELSVSMVVSMIASVAAFELVLGLSSVFVCEPSFVFAFVFAFVVVFEQSRVFASVSVLR